ncbi:MAG TPA: stage II sporulation protein M [Verrucomicrobiae bacterium]|nr:stage II sporulation protein M [Verrucomicrobiae bacterium]
MISVSWLKKRQSYWEKLESLLTRAKKQGLHTLSRSELRELGLLYRQTATDLSAVRGDPSSVQQSRYLNQLLGRAHNAIYAGQKKSIGGIWHYYTHQYPRVFRRLLPYTAAATAIFFLGSLAGAFFTLSDADYARQFLPPNLIASIDRHEMWTHSIVSIKPQASSAIMTNNMSVSFMTFAAGITAGLGTLYLLFFNGMMLGVIGVACGTHDMGIALWSFVLPHGVLELPAIFIAGGAGLRLAQALMFPGALSRRDSLAVGGTQAVRLLVGVIPILIVAGSIEAFFSPSETPAYLKFLAAGGLFTLLITYLWGGARSAQHNADRARSGSALSPTDIG